MFTCLPRTAYFIRVVEPKLPTVTTPVLIAIRTQSPR